MRVTRGKSPNALNADKISQYMSRIDACFFLTYMQMSTMAKLHVER